MTEGAPAVRHGQIRRHPDGRLLLVGQWSGGLDGKMHYCCVMPVVRASMWGSACKQHPSRSVLFRIPKGWKKSMKHRTTEQGLRALSEMPVVYDPGRKEAE